MTYFCKNCGEGETFFIKKYFTESSSEDEIVDAEGENIDYVNHEVDDSELTDNDGARCSSCDDTVENYSEEELEVAKAEYRENHKEDIMKKEGVKSWKEHIEEENEKTLS